MLLYMPYIFDYQYLPFVNKAWNVWPFIKYGKIQC